MDEGIHRAARRTERGRTGGARGRSGLAVAVAHVALSRHGIHGAAAGTERSAQQDSLLSPVIVA